MMIAVLRIMIGMVAVINMIGRVLIVMKRRSQAIHCTG